MTFDFIHGYNYKSNAYDVVEIKFENHVPRSRVGIIIFLLLMSDVCMDDVCLYVIILHWYHLSPLSSISALYSTPLWHLQCERDDDISVWGEDGCGMDHTHVLIQWIYMSIVCGRDRCIYMWVCVCMCICVHSSLTIDIWLTISMCVYMSEEWNAYMYCWGYVWPRTYINEYKLTQSMTLCSVCIDAYASVDAWVEWCECMHPSSADTHTHAFIHSHSYLPHPTHQLSQ